MNFLSWNCQGLGSDLTIRSLKEIIKKHRPSIVFLMETKQKHNRLTKLGKDLGFTSEFYVDPVGAAGGLCLWWDDSMNVDVLLFTKNLIDTKVVMMGSGTSFHASWIYGTPYREDKDTCWMWLTTSILSNNLPWLCIGDFNEILWAFEKQGGRAFCTTQRRHLSDFMNTNELLDLGFQGQAYTWCGKRTNGVLIRERLDRGLINI